MCWKIYYFRYLFGVLLFLWRYYYYYHFFYPFWKEDLASVQRVFASSQNNSEVTTSSKSVTPQDKPGGQRGSRFLTFPQSGCHRLCNHKSWTVGSNFPIENVNLPPILNPTVKKKKHKKEKSTTISFGFGIKGNSQSDLKIVFKFFFEGKRKCLVRKELINGGKLPFRM